MIGGNSLVGGNCGVAIALPDVASLLVFIVKNLTTFGTLDVYFQDFFVTCLVSVQEVLILANLATFLTLLWPSFFWSRDILQPHLPEDVPMAATGTGTPTPERL